MKKFFIAVFSVILAVISIISLAKSNNNTSLKASEELDLDVAEYCLIDSATGTILAEKNCREKREVASMVKLMTSLLTMEKIECGEWNLETELLVSDYAASMEGSQAFLDAGKTYKIDDLLKSVIVASANDSSVVLAENYSGSEKKFVDVMNKRAAELGLTNTLYDNSTGLPALNQYSTAEDIAKLLNIVSKHDLYHRYSTIWMDKLVHESGRETELVNTNRLIKYYPGCDCGKTGFTDEAGYCLSASAKRDNMRLISVVMGAKTASDRFSTSSSLLNYGFSNFKSVKVVDLNDMFDSKIKIKGIKETIKCNPESEIYVLQKSGQNDKNYELNITFNAVKQPINKLDLVGKIEVIQNGQVVGSSNLLASDNYKSPSFIDITHAIFDNWTI